MDRCAARPHRPARAPIVAVTSSPATVSSSGSTVRRSAAVASSPSSAAQAPAMSRASSGVKNVPGTLCAIARPNSPAARGIASSAATDPPPADSPNTVTRPGSPPNARMLSRTHSSAATWSSSPRFAGAPSMCANPSMPTR